MITLATNTVFRCKCDRPECGYEWDTLVKPLRCAGCKYRSWNSEDRRFLNKFDNEKTKVAVGSRVNDGEKVPDRAKLQPKELLKLLTATRDIVDTVIQSNPCDHAKNDCVCAEKKTLAEIDRQIRKLRPYVEGPGHAKHTKNGEGKAVIA
jgi:hypothetical protein